MVDDRRKVGGPVELYTPHSCIVGLYNTMDTTAERVGLVTILFTQVRNRHAQV